MWTSAFYFGSGGDATVNILGPFEASIKNELTATIDEQTLEAQTEAPAMTAISHSVLAAKVIEVKNG